MPDSIEDRIAQAIGDPGSILPRYSQSAGEPYETVTRWATRSVMSVLEAAGRLLPEGATPKSEFVMRWYLVDETFIEWGSSMLAGARDLADGPPVGAVRGEIRGREHWAGPWSVVEPVAVKEASDG